MNKLISAAVTFSLALSLASAPAARAASFTDVPEDAWYAPAAEWCLEEGILNGTAPGIFSPERSVTRAMAVTALYRLSGSPEGGGDSGLSDVPAWCAPAVSWAVDRGIVTGYEDGTFRPQLPATRQQLSAFFWRCAGSPAPSGQEQPFADGGTIAPYARDAVLWAREAGVVSGYEDGTFRPQGTALRAHLAKMLMGFRTLLRPALSVLSEMDVECSPSGIAAAEDGALLVTDLYGKVVWRVKDGGSTVYAGASSVEDPYGEPLGGYNDAELEKSLFRAPWAIAPFLGGWAVTDRDNNAVRLLLPEGTETVNLTVKNLQSAGDFHGPTGLAADGDGNLYVADTLTGSVRKVTPQGTASAAASGLNNPTGLCWHQGSLYVAETGAHRILKITGAQVEVLAGTGDEGFRDGPAASAAFASPQGVAVGPDGAVYVSDTVNRTVRVIRNGQVRTLAQGEGMDPFPVSPAGLLVRGGRLLVCDSFARRIFSLPLN